MSRVALLIPLACWAGLSAVGSPPNRCEETMERASLTVIPPGPVTDKIRVELRLAIPEAPGAHSAPQVSFYWDHADLAHRIDACAAEAVPYGFALAQAWAETAGHAGKHRLLFRAENDGAVQEGSWPIEVIPSATPAVLRLQAGWLDPLALSGEVYPRQHAATEQDVRDTIDGMARLGMRTAIVTYVEYQGSFFYPSNLRFYDRDVQREAAGQTFSFDVVGAVLSAADRKGMHVFLGLGRGGDTYLLWQFDRPDRKECNEAAITTSRRVAGELWGRYHHHPSFYGWYLTHEMNDLARASAYYDPVADFCHSLAPDKPVMVAPAGTPILDRETLSRSHVDIFAYQDAVGSGYVPYRNTFQPEKRLAMLDEIYGRYQRWHQGTSKHLWSDLEIWEMDGTAGYGGAYPAAFSRVERQMEIEARYVEMLTAYEIFGFMEPPGRHPKLKDPRAARLFRDYATSLSR